MNTVAVTRMGSESFLEKKGLNLILSFFVKVLVGFEDPVSCKSIRCTSIIAIRIIGRMKCSEKNRFSVGCETDGPPQIHVTRSLPIIGIADRVPVITVAPQNDICPHGSTYPRNAVAITVKRMTVPESQTFI